MDLEDFFDEDIASILLDTDTRPATMAKSLYGFDLTSKDGILSLLSVIDVIDEEILKDLSGYLWRDYVPSNMDLAREQMKGILLDVYRGL